MKNTIQKSLVIALCYYAVAIISCGEKICPPLKNKKFQYKSVSVDNLEYTFYSDSYDDTAFEKKTVVNDTVDRLQYGIRLRFDYGIAANYRKTPALNLMNVACAKYVSCPANDYYTSADTVKKLSILTLRDFDSRYPKGSDMTKMFSFIHKNSLKYLARNTLDELDEWRLRSPDQSGNADMDVFFSNEISYLSKLMEFEIRVQYTNGKIFTAQTRPVFLK